MRLIFIFFIAIVFSNDLQSQTEFIECDSVFPYRGENWKFGLSSSEGRKITEPQYDNIVFKYKFSPQQYFVFHNTEENTSGILNSKGKILVDKLPGISSDFYIDISGCIISYEYNHEEDLVVYSGCLEKLLGQFKYGNVDHNPTSLSPWGKAKKEPRPRFVISAKNIDEALLFNGLGEKLSFENEKNNRLCKQGYNLRTPENCDGIRKSTNNVEAYQAYFPEYNVIEEYYNSSGSISLLVQKDNLFGLINTNGEVILPIENRYIEFDDGVLKIKTKSYSGLYSCDGTTILKPIHTYISVNDPIEGLILVDTKMGCRGYCDFRGNIFLPIECLESN